MMKLNEYRNQLDKSQKYTNAKKELKLHFALGDAILKARIKKGWTQKELAKAIGTKQANISRIESGLENPTLEFINRLSTVLDFAIEFICENEVAVQFTSKIKNETLRDFYTGLTPIPNNSLVFDLSSEQSITQEKEVYAC